MPESVLLSRPGTHEVLNQPPPLVDYNLFSSNQVLAECLEREGAGWARQRAQEFGRLLGTEDAIRWGFQANENPPVLHTHDRFGNRRDEVEYHPAWHDLVRLSVEYAVHCLPWLDPRPGAYPARCALLMLASENEAGHLCPISMTCSALPVLRLEPDLAKEWTPRILSTRYDPALRPATEKSGVMVGMAMTEKQGGSDVRANTTRAEPLDGGAGREFLLTGHKWFCSAPMCDAFLVLAQAPRGLSCFLLPRWTPDGERNGFKLQRLKRKLGNCSNASSEVEFDGAWARLVGEEGRGVANIIEMANHSRLDCIVASTGGMHQAVTQAIHHARHRSAFGRLLADQPLMRNVLADLCIETEAATVLMMRLARAFDSQQTDRQERGFARLAAAAAKYWVCKRAPGVVGEALECLGGNGYVEESILPRLYREMPLNSLWEGCGNVLCLDVLRAMIKESGSIETVQSEIRLASGADRRLDAYIAALEQELAGSNRNAADLEAGARRLAERLALALQGSLLVRYSIPAVADAFCGSRLAGDWGCAYGTLPSDTHFQAIIGRAFPA